MTSTSPALRPADAPVADAPVADAPVADEPGQYPTGRAGFSRAWDGHAWADTLVPDETAPELGPPRHSLRPTWRLWAALGALLVAVALAGWGGSQQSEVLRTTVLVVAAVLATGGALLALTGSVWRRLGIRAASRANGWSPRRLVLLGVASGLVAVGLALALELTASSVLGLGTVTVLFLAGPIEEAAKLALPVVLFLTLRGRLADPRVGFALVWVSGVTFGLLEGVEYIVGIGPKSAHVRTDELATVVGGMEHTILRTLVELMHPLLAAGAAAVLWLCAWRGGRLLTRAGVLAYLVAALLHGVNDGVVGGWVAEVSSWLSLAGSPVMVTVIYLVLRVRARELVPPDRLPAQPPRWRPRVRPSGSDGARRAAGPAR